MQFSEREITDEERSSIRAITEEYPSASRMFKAAFAMMKMLKIGDDPIFMFGFELGLRVATSSKAEILRQVLELMDRGRSKVNNQDTSTVTEMMASLIAREAEHE